MKQYIQNGFVAFFVSLVFTACGNNPIVTGAEQLSEYLPSLKNIKVGVVVNPTSMVGSTHLVDVLIANGITVNTIFCPEHGFRGDADAGEKIRDDIDAKTGVPIVSLYGQNKKPSSNQILKNDIIVFDIQDVGVRFYTYISTMHMVMEACAENNIPLIILDRPNPNGMYVDGPVLDMKYKSFVGVHPIPVVHGLTVGELALMINGEKWLANGVQCNLKIVKCKEYDHSCKYSLPIKPSPNLPNDNAIALYPSLCFFEGTPISLGRGTLFPFEVIGYPDAKFGSFTFTPKSIEGMSKNPPFEGQKCYGVDFRNTEVEYKLNLTYLINYYNMYSDKEKYFNVFFTNLAGNQILKEQITDGLSQEEIKKSWSEDLKKYKLMRAKYLLYNDVE